MPANDPRKILKNLKFLIIPTHLLQLNDLLFCVSEVNFVTMCITFAVFINCHITITNFNVKKMLWDTAVSNLSLNQMKYGFPNPPH